MASKNLGVPKASSTGAKNVALPVLEEQKKLNAGINYEAEQFKNVEAQKEQALNEADTRYNDMINQSDSFYQAQIDASKEWADKQSQLQQENTDFTIEQINQQKDKAQKDYEKEQSGAYVDWQKQSNQYGAGAEQMAAQGLQGTGYSESSQVSMYNAYQGRVAVAREVVNAAMLNYDNSIKEAQLQNNSKLAEIAFQAQQTQLELALQGFQYKNQLVTEQMKYKQELDNTYYGRWMDVLEQQNKEREFTESQRQFNASYEMQQKQFEENIRQWNAEYNLQQKQFKESIRQFDAEIKRLKDKDAKEYKIEIQRLELQKKQLKQEQAQWEAEMKEKKREYEKTLAEEKRQFDKSLAASKSSGGGGGGGGGGDASITKDSYAVNTAYYQGSLNSDANKYGTFSNGYQPKGISGHGKVSKTGDTITFKTETLSGQKQTVTQNIWKAADGTKWYWDGRYNKYIKVK